jgi:hypothetical protein
MWQCPKCQLKNSGFREYCFSCGLRNKHFFKYFLKEDFLKGALIAIVIDFFTFFALLAPGRFDLLKIFGLYQFIFLLPAIAIYWNKKEARNGILLVSLIVFLFNAGCLLINLNPRRIY